MSKRMFSGLFEISAPRRTALRSAKRTPGRETTSSLIRSSTGSEMRPSFFATCIIGLFEHRDSRTQFSSLARESSLRDNPSEFILDAIEHICKLDADIRPNFRIEFRFAESVKW